LKYDDVMNTQREIIYAERQKALGEDGLKEHVLEMIDHVLNDAMDEFVPPDALPDEWNLHGLRDWMRRRLGLLVRFDDIDLETVEPEEIFEKLQSTARLGYEEKEQRLGSDLMREIESAAILRAVDTRWKDHLYAMDLLKEGIGLRAYGQRDPLVEYKQEGYKLFSDMMSGVKLESLEFLFRVQVREPEILEESVPATSQAVLSAHDASVSSLSQTARRQREGSDAPKQAVGVAAEAPRRAVRTPERVGEKVGRNAPCPCGSGKKYKRCCGA